MNAHSVFVKWMPTMPYESELSRACAEIDRARTEVAKAQEAYSQGGASLRRVNEANRALADAHAIYRECSGLVVPDRR
jgi:hypothetical protein